jgi:hypothetical protein
LFDEIPEYLKSHVVTVDEIELNPRRYGNEFELIMRVEF